MIVLIFVIILGTWKYCEVKQGLALGIVSFVLQKHVARISILLWSQKESIIQSDLEVHRLCACENHIFESVHNTLKHLGKHEYCAQKLQLMRC